MNALRHTLFTSSIRIVEVQPPAASHFLLGWQDKYDVPLSR